MEEDRIWRNILMIEEGFFRKRWERYYVVLHIDECLLMLFDQPGGVVSGSSLLPVRQYYVQSALFFDCVVARALPCSIRIVPTSGEFADQFVYVHAPGASGSRVIDELKQVLEQCGSSFEGKDNLVPGSLCCPPTDLTQLAQGSGGAPRIERVPVSQWTHSDVEVWLETTGLSLNQPELLQVFRENDVDGTIILELDGTQLFNIGVPQPLIDEVLIECQRLQKYGRFSRSRQRVKSKFARYAGFTSFTEDMAILVDSMSDASLLKHRFLSLADLSSHTLLQASEAEFEEAGIPLPSEMEQLHETETVVSDEGIAVTRAVIKVKLVVTEILQSSRAKTLRKIASPIVSALIPRFQEEFGWFHTAVIVGPWYLEWTDSELCVPKAMISGRAIVSADVDEIRIPESQLPTIADRLADVLIKWNTTYHYTASSNRRQDTLAGNCQDFVDDVLQAIGVSPTFRGALGEFLDRMRREGQCVLEFRPCVEFRDFFGLSWESKVFASHLELDEFCVGLQEIESSVHTTFFDEWTLLKSFDRAFWLRYFRDPGDERYVPRPTESLTHDLFNSGCPFLDPRLTKSYAV